MALRDRVLNQRISRAKVQQIILVDAWRHKEHRRLLDLARLRGILDQLNQLIFENHGARGSREVAADFKGCLIDSCDASLLKVIDQILHSIGKAGRSGLNCLADNFWIGRGKVRWTHRINKLTSIKTELQFCFVVDLSSLDKFVQLLGTQQI